MQYEFLQNHNPSLALIFFIIINSLMIKYAIVAILAIAMAVSIPLSIQADFHEEVKPTPSKIKLTVSVSPDTVKYGETFTVNGAADGNATSYKQVYVKFFALDKTTFTTFGGVYIDDDNKYSKSFVTSDIDFNDPVIYRIDVWYNNDTVSTSLNYTGK